MITKRFSNLLLSRRNKCANDCIFLREYSRVAAAGEEASERKRTKVQGWVRAIRKMKENTFLDVDDGSSPRFLQIVVAKGKNLNGLSYGSSIAVEGESSVFNGRAELHAEKVDVTGKCVLEEGYPFAPRIKYSMDYVRQYLHLRPRTRYFSSMMRLRDLASHSISEHMRSRNFILTHTPILTSNDCEGAGEVFTVKPQSEELLKRMVKEETPFEDSYFNGKAYLTVSGQLHLEVMARALSKVYTFGPTFRAENSKSRLHLSEFYMLEAEMAFVENIDDITVEVESLIKSMTRYMLDRGAADIHAIGAPVPKWLDTKFSVMSYDDAIAILESNSKSLATTIRPGGPFTKEHELFLVKYNNEIPIFVVDWPKEIKPFYTKVCSSDSTKVAAMDLLVPDVGELVGGSLREDDYDALKAKIPSNLDFNWYLELRKFGNVPTGGFGMGFERYLQTVLKTANIKDVIPFPRWPHNCSL